MDADYTFVLKSNKKDLLKKIVLGLYVVLSLAIIFSLIKDNFKANKIKIFSKIIFLIFSLIIIRAIKINEKLILFAGIVFSILLSFFIYNYLGLLFTFVFISFISFIFLFAYQPSVVTINSTCIQIKTWFIKRNISWQTLNNIVLKDGIFTIDFKNDKLIQESIENEFSVLEESEFNEFVKKYMQ